MNYWGDCYQNAKNKYQVNLQKKKVVFNKRSEQWFNFASA